MGVTGSLGHVSKPDKGLISAGPWRMPRLNVGPFDNISLYRQQKEERMCEILAGCLYVSEWQHLLRLPTRKSLPSLKLI